MKLIDDCRRLPNAIGVLSVIVLRTAETTQNLPPSVCQYFNKLIEIFNANQGNSITYRYIYLYYVYHHTSCAHGWVHMPNINKTISTRFRHKRYFSDNKLILCDWKINDHFTPKIFLAEMKHCTAQINNTMSTIILVCTMNYQKSVTSKIFSMTT